jgi:hypothetical protein
LFIQRTASFFVFLLLASSLRIIAFAQPAQPPDDQKPQAQSTPAQTTEKPKGTEPKVLGTPVPPNTDKNPQDKNAGTSNDRLFFTLPNFLTLENGGQVPPLTTKQKFKAVARSSFDYVLYPWYGFYRPSVRQKTVKLVMGKVGTATESASGRHLLMEPSKTSSPPRSSRQCCIRIPAFSIRQGWIQPTD